MKVNANAYRQTDRLAGCRAGEKIGNRCVKGRRCQVTAGQEGVAGSGSEKGEEV